MIVAIPLLLGVLGVALLIWGWRGKRLDDHPVCRKCRFDLTGVYPQREACPECGGDTHAPKAIRIGNRKRRPTAAVFGALIALGAGLAMFNTSTIDGLLVTADHWWKIEYAMRTHDPATLDELESHWLGGPYGPPADWHVKRMAKHAIAFHGDRNRAWHSIWDLAITHAMNNGDLSQGDCDRYAQGLKDAWQLWYRPKVSGEPNARVFEWVFMNIEASDRVTDFTPVRVNFQVHELSIADRVIASDRKTDRIAGRSHFGFEPAWITVGTLGAMPVPEGVDGSSVVAMSGEIVITAEVESGQQSIEFAYPVHHEATMAELASSDYWRRPVPASTEP